MKINPTSVKTSQTHSASPARAQGATADKTTHAVSATASSAVALSSTARHLANLENSDGDFNIVRVNEIRQALEAGTLKIDPERIADGLIDSAHELLAQK